jgi:hypothetical protein
MSKGELKNLFLMRLKDQIAALEENERKWSFKWISFTFQEPLAKASAAADEPAPKLLLMV